MSNDRNPSLGHNDGDTQKEKMSVYDSDTKAVVEGAPRRG